MIHFGPAYDPSLDGERLAKQHERIRDFMLLEDRWYSLGEIARALGYPEASVSAQLRHLRKPEFGGYVVDKRRRQGHVGTWEYHVEAPPKFREDAAGQFDFFVPKNSPMVGH